jgi:hypothetical protein
VYTDMKDYSVCWKQRVYKTSEHLVGFNKIVYQIMYGINNNFNKGL